jgi:hypothetical protein
VLVDARLGGSRLVKFVGRPRSAPSPAPAPLRPSLSMRRRLLRLRCELSGSGGWARLRVFGSSFTDSYTSFTFLWALEKLKRAHLKNQIHLQSFFTTKSINSQ